MSTIEYIAAFLGVVSVGLNIKQKVMAWPIGAVMVGLYAFIFFRERLYADSALQVVYFVLQFYGWYQWLYGSKEKSTLKISKTPRKQLWLFLFLGIFLSFGLATALKYWTNQDFPYLDSAITVFSLIAQWMLARKYIENWILWFYIDAVAAGLYFAKNLYPTAVLYFIFLGLAVMGYREWKKELSSV